MLFLKLTLISLITGKESSLVKKIKQELITDIYKEMITTFNNTYETRTTNNCEQIIKQSIKTNGLLTGFNLRNDATAKVSCNLGQASAAELKNDIASSLIAAIKKKIDTDVLSTLNQDTTSMESKIKNLITTITNESIMMARQIVINDLENDLKFGEIDAITSENVTETFFASEAVSQVVNKVVISTIVDEIVTTVVNKVIDSITIANKVIDSTPVTNIVEAKTETDTAQKVKSEGIIDCIGGVNSNIFWFILVIIILVLAGIGYTYTYTYKMSCSQQQQQL